MDALGLQAALVKLDPETTVTPIGTGIKQLSSSRHHNHLYHHHHHHHHHHHLHHHEQQQQQQQQQQNRITYTNVDDNDLTICNIRETTRQSSLENKNKIEQQRNLNSDNDNNDEEKIQQKINAVNKCTMSEVR